MQNASHLIVTYLLNSIWQVTLVFAVAALCSVLLRRTSAKARHALWVSALGLSVLLPVCSLRRVTALTSSETTSTDSVDTTLRVTAVANKSTARPHRFHLRRLSPIHAAPWFSWTLAGCYVAFVLYRAVRLCLAGRRTSVLNRMADAPLTSGPLVDIVERYSGAMGLRPAPSVHLTDGVGPVTIGARRPILLVPAAFSESASEPELTSAVCHELAHIRRHDFLLNLMCELMWLPVSFHPVAALIKSRIDGTRELACDEIAARMLSAPAVYARSLVSIATAMSSSAPVRQFSYGQGLFDSERLEERVMNLVGNRRLITGPLAHGLAVLTTGLLAVASVSAATYSVQIAEPASSSGSATPAVGAAQWKADTPIYSSPTAPGGLRYPVTTNRSTAIRSFKLQGGSEVPDAQELLAKVLSSQMYDSNFRSEIPERVQAFYREYGYFRAIVTESSFKDAGPSAVDVMVAVSAGQQYRLEDITFEGNHAASESEIRAVYPIRPGEVFRMSAMQAGSEALRRLYEERGAAAAIPMVAIIANAAAGTVLVKIGADGARYMRMSGPGQSPQSEAIPDLPGYYNVGDGVTAPRAIYSPDPGYDPISRAAKSQGTAVYRVGVGSNGLVKELRFVRSRDDVNGGELMPGLIQNGLDSLRTWRFEPARKDGQPVPVQVNVEVNFRMYSGR